MATFIVPSTPPKVSPIEEVILVELIVAIPVKVELEVVMFRNIKPVTLPLWIVNVLSNCAVLLKVSLAVTTITCVPLANGQPNVVAIENELFLFAFGSEAVPENGTPANCLNLTHRPVDSLAASVVSILILIWDKPLPSIIDQLAKNAVVEKFEPFIAAVPLIVISGTVESFILMVIFLEFRFLLPNVSLRTNLNDIFRPSNILCPGGTVNVILLQPPVAFGVT